MSNGRNPLVWDRHPKVKGGIPARADKLGKSDWCDLYFDLFRQTHSDDATDEAIMADAERRRRTIEPLVQDQREASKRARLAAGAQL